MAAQDKATFKQDLTEPVKIRHYEGVVFTGDDCGNLINVALFDGGVPYSGGGTVSATAVLADGTTFPLTQGSITGNMVSVPLEAGALVVSGLMGLYVKISGGGIICTVLNAVFTVQATDTGMVPAAMVTTVNELVQEIKDAQDSFPADLTNLLAAVAPTFSTSVAYSAGAYIWQGGKLYRFTAAHPAGTWTGTDAAAVALGNDVSDLKSALLKSATTKYVGSGTSVTGGTEPSKAGYIDTNGDYQSSSLYRSTDFIEIEAYVKIYSYVYGLTSICNIAFYDASKTFISGISASESWGTVRGYQEIPSTARYYRICIMNANAGGYITCEDVSRVSTEQIGQVYDDIADLDAKIDTVDEKISQKYKVMVSDISGGLSGYIDGDGNFNSTASWIVTPFISVKEITEMKEHVAAYTTVPYAVYYDQYKVFIEHETASSRGFADKTLNIPDNAYYVRLNMIVADTTQYYEYTVDNLKAAAITVKNTTDSMYGKKIGAAGDSITIGTYSVPGQTYVDQIANAHNMTVDNQAIWGSVFPTGKTQNGNPQGSIYSQIADISSDCDMIVISGGINDADYWNTEGYWGVISNGYNDTLDTTTFCGAFEGTLKAALDKWKGKPIVFVFEHRMTQTYDSVYGQHFENTQFPLMVQMLEKWGVPYVDLFHDMPSIKLTSGYIALYSYDNQGVHPNVAGYRKFYVPRVESKLIELAK